MDLFIFYNRIVVTLIVLPVILLIGVTVTLQPLDGDLTRIGGHSEGRFGWNKPQVLFEKSQFLVAKSIGDYNREFDVVVLGDSFSAHSTKGWENYLVEHTGLSVIMFYMADGYTLSDITNSEAYNIHPPKLLIYESVERLAFSRLHELSHKSWPLSANKELSGLPSEALVYRVQAKKRINRRNSLGLEQRFSEAVSLIDKSKFRRLGRDNGKTMVFPLVRSDLFSSGDPSSLLVVMDDTKKVFSDNDVKQAVLGVNKARSAVEANGHTRFFLMIFPDKLTAYSSFLDPAVKQVSSFIPALAAHYPLLRLDKSFEVELQQGAKDLYLPNDTHTGSYGHEVAALSLIDFVFH
ncbi:MAG: hypothetical protein ABFS08_07670 [Pseudomonadota bacterium]